MDIYGKSSYNFNKDKAKWQKVSVRDEKMSAFMNLNMICSP
jgi:hypothetical protein